MSGFSSCDSGRECRTRHDATEAAVRELHAVRAALVHLMCLWRGLDEDTQTAWFVPDHCRFCRKIAEVVGSFEVPSGAGEHKE